MDLSEGMASSVTQTEKTSPAKSFEYRLDLLTFALSGLRDGLGPLLGVFLIQKTHWDAFQIASVLAASGITNLVLQIPIGCLYDTTVSPYLLVGSGALMPGGIMLHRQSGTNLLRRFKQSNSRGNRRLLIKCRSSGTFGSLHSDRTFAQEACPQRDI